jgi:hypothetical protein
MGETMEKGGKTFSILGPSIELAKATKGISLVVGIGMIVGIIGAFVLGIGPEVEEKGNLINLGVGLGFLISGVAAIVPNKVKEFGYARYKNAYTKEDLEKEMENLNDMFKNVNYAVDFLTYAGHLDLDDVIELAIDAVGGIVSGTNELITGSLILSAFSGSWSKLARVILGIVYLVLGINFIVQFVAGLIE